MIASSILGPEQQAGLARHVRAGGNGEPVDLNMQAFLTRDSRQHHSAAMSGNAFGAGAVEQGELVGHAGSERRFGRALAGVGVEIKLATLTKRVRLRVTLAAMALGQDGFGGIGP